MNSTPTVMRTRLAVAGLIIGAVALGGCSATSQATVPSPAATPSVATSANSFLFAIPADRGSLVPIGGSSSTFALTLSGVDYLTFFTDRPARKSGASSVKKFVDAWPTSFAADPPNIALTLPDGPGASDTLVAVMTEPRITVKTQIFKATLAILGPGQIERLSKSGTHLAFHAARADPSLPMTFGAATLFIDSLVDWT